MIYIKNNKDYYMKVVKMLINETNIFIIFFK